MNSDLKKAQYAVRGELVLKAMEIQHELESGSARRPFDRLTFCNIGNPHELRQPPITFFRQVLALTTWPALADAPGAEALFPPDALARARHYIAHIPGGTGARGTGWVGCCLRATTSHLRGHRKVVWDAPAQDLWTHH